MVKGDPHPPKTLVRPPGSVSDLLVPAVALSADNGCPGPEGLGRAGPVPPLHVYSSQPLHFVVVLVPLRISEHGPDCRIYSVELHPCRAKVAPPPAKAIAQLCCSAVLQHRPTSAAPAFIEDTGSSASPWESEYGQDQQGVRSSPSIRGELGKLRPGMGLIQEPRTAPRSLLPLQTCSPGFLQPGHLSLSIHGSSMLVEGGASQAVFSRNS